MVEEKKCLGQDKSGAPCLGSGKYADKFCWRHTTCRK